MSVTKSSEFAGLLRSYRRLQGLTQKDLAERCAVSQVAVCKWESGRVSLSEETLIKIAHAYGYRSVVRFLMDAYRDVHESL